MIVPCDLHNHSCLSPCGSLELSPALLARLAKERGLGLVALTDHNSALNTPAFAVCARREGLAALYGMEACSTEEVHVLCLFDTPEAAMDFGGLVLGFLQRFPYDAGRMGDQAVVDAEDNILDLPDYYLGAALELGFAELCTLASERGGLVIPAHIDRPVYGALTQLGFLPRGPYAAVEAVRPLPSGASAGYTVITGSDAHYPEHVGRRPFGLDLPLGWQSPDGRVDLTILGEALLAGRVRLPFSP
jgi:hypothetical protein